MTLNLRELQALSTPELIDLCATKLMRWKKWYWEEPAHGRAWGWVHEDHYASHRDKKNCDAYWQWNPVGDYEYLGKNVKGDWNATMQVIDTRRGQLFSGRKRFRQAWEHVTGVNMSEALTHMNQREICIAAIHSLSE